jgi:hypothetical protein
MYKNPLNNGDISDYNSLKKQTNNGSIVKKYQSKKLETKPTELQKYYQYQTYQQPILDELNYVAERMRTEDIKKKTDDYEFTEKLKIKKEGLMKDLSKEEGKDIAREELFDISSTKKNDDMTPIINTDVELEYPTEPQPQPITISDTPQIQSLMSDLFGEGDSVLNDIFSIADTAPIREEKFELSKENKKKQKTPEELAEIEAKKEAKKAAKKAATAAKKAAAAEKKAAKEETVEEKAANKIKYAYKNKKAREEFINTGADKKIEEIKALIKENSSIASQAETIKNVPKNKRNPSKGKLGNKGGKKK